MNKNPSNHTQSIFSTSAGKVAACDDEGSEISKSFLKHLQDYQNLPFPEIFEEWENKAVKIEAFGIADKENN